MVLLNVNFKYLGRVKADTLLIINFRIVKVMANENAKVVSEVMSINDKVANVLKDGKSKRLTVTLTSVTTEVKKAANGKEYINSWLDCVEGLPGAQQQADGSYAMGILGSFQTPFNSVLLVMRKDVFYGRYANAIGEYAEIGAVSQFFGGVKIDVLCQFVAAGEEAKNPLVRNGEPYAVKEYDRYVYHIVGIAKPTDECTAAEYAVLNREIAQDARERIKAMREAKAKTASVAATMVAAQTAAPF